MGQSNSTSWIGISLTWFGILEEKNEEEKNWRILENCQNVRELVKLGQNILVLNL